MRSWWLSKKKNKEAWIKPIIQEDGSIRYEVQHNANGPKGDDEGTVSRKGAVSIVDGTPIDLKYIRQEGKAGRLGVSLIAIVGDSDNGRMYFSPTSSQVKAATVDEPTDKPLELLPEHALGFRVQAYGFKRWSDLFTNRQLITLTNLADTVSEIHEQVFADASASGISEGKPLDEGGNGARAYADALSVYLSLAVSRQANRSSSICTWDKTRETIRNVFARQAIAMTWDFAEANPFSSKSGNS